MTRLFALLTFLLFTLTSPLPGAAQSLTPEQTGTLQLLVEGDTEQVTPLPPLRYDADDALNPVDAAFLEEVGRALRVFPAQTVRVIFQTQTAAGQSPEGEPERELARINAAFMTIALAAGESPPRIEFTDPPATVAPLSDQSRVFLILPVTIFAPTPEPDAERAQALAGIAGMRLGQSLDLPPLVFAADNTPTPGSAAFLATLAATMVEQGEERYRITLRPQTSGGINPDEEWQREIARFQTVLTALDGFDGNAFTGKVEFSPSPPQMTRLTDQMQMQLTLASLLAQPPALWQRFPGAPHPYGSLAFTADSPAVEFRLTDPRLLDTDTGMVDLWASPEWYLPNGFDPTLLTLSEGDKTRISLHILDDRSGLAVWNGDGGMYLSLDYDFTRNRPYHIALVTSGNETLVFVDGSVLSPALPIGYGAADPVTLTLGNDAEALSPFTGRINRARIWHDLALPADLARMGQTEESIPAEHDPLNAALSEVVWYNFQTLRTEIRPVPPLRSPAEGWWAPITAADVRLLNSGDYLSGKSAPVFSEMQQEWQRENISRAAQPPSSSDPVQRAAVADAALNPHFSVREAFRLTQDSGIDLAALTVPQAMQTPNATTMAWQKGDPNWGLKITTDTNGIVSVHSSRCSTSARVGDPWTCPDPFQQGVHLLVFDTDEYITAMDWALYEKGLRFLRFTTNKRVTKVLGGDGYENDTFVKGYSVTLPAGVTPTNWTVWHNSPVLNRMVGFGLGFNPDHSRPGLTLVSETGLAMRFLRKYDSTFISADNFPDLIGSLPFARREARPWLTWITDERFRISGVPVEFTNLAERETAKPGTGYNDTFVSLSKAVNLQASYMGYDIVKMDPLHLTKTGTRHPVFQQPDGQSRDYYDANRIFVPKGLFYFPEYTGKNHGSVISADTYAEYRDSFSDTVSAGIGGKLAPVSFKASLTMTSAKQSITDRKNSRTRGLSRAVFYDLVIDKQHIALDDRFRAEASRLPATQDLDSFIDIFGTHYPVAVVYGGMGVLEIDATEDMRQTLKQQGIGVKVEASVLLDEASQTSASFGAEHQEDHSKTFRDVVGSQTENFYWIGGTHAGAEHSSWTVGTDGVVPVHVALRPIHELLSPLFFDDPRVYSRVRVALKTRIDERLAAEAASLPGGQDDTLYMVEVRMDAITCTVTPPTDFRVAGQTRRSDGVYVNAPLVTMFPMYSFAAFDSQGFLLRNLEDHKVDEDTDYKPFSQHCPSHVNLLEKSPYSSDNALFRFGIQAQDLLQRNSDLIMMDRRDLESAVLKPLIKLDSKPVQTEELLTGLTGGIYFLMEQLFTKDGSPLLKALNPEPRPTMVQQQLNLGDQFCRPQGGCPRNQQDLDSLAGVWIKKTLVPPLPATCPGCARRRIDFSIRLLK